MNTATELAQHLLQIGAVKLSPHAWFTWASGRQSPIYCDNRKTLSHPKVREFIKRTLVERSQELGKFNCVAGVATAGIPHATLLADALQLPMIYTRAKAKEHGLRNTIEGELPPHARVLVVEDLISTGGSSLKAVDDVRAAGAEVVGVLALFSYGFEAATLAFEQAKCPLLALTDYSHLVAAAVAGGHVSANDVTMLEDWRASF